MQLHKTSRAWTELKPGVRTLGQRERTLLLLADGSRSAQDFQILFGGEGEKIALRLLEEGYLTKHEAQALAKAPAPARVKTRPVHEPEAITPSELPSISSFGPPPGGADPFEGKRSLATTRMFLFDICERLFARRNPLMAEQFREALRNARDRKSMLDTSRLMLEHIEMIAGHERADAISERLAMILPDETLAETKS
jgi:hypothetical protein